MNSGLTDENADDYYGLTNLKTVQTKKPRKMKRTQLSNQKKSNHQQKSFSNQRDSRFSNLQSKRSQNKNGSVLRNSQSRADKSSLLGCSQNILPSCTEFHSINNSSTRKNKLQINTGVVGIKMDSVSPNNFVSHPSRVLIVNESISGKKGSKSKKQKSILYVQYNNFMTEFQNNKNQNKDNVSNGKHKENYTKKHQNSSKSKKELNSKKNIKSEDIQNQYFIGMKKQCLSPVNKNVINNNETPKSNQSKLLVTPKKNGQSVINLSITSAKGDKLESPKLFTNSPNVLKTQPSERNANCLSKNKVSIQDIAAFKHKNILNKDNQKNANQSKKHQKFSFNSKNDQKNGNLMINKLLTLSSQKKLKEDDFNPIKKYNTQKQLQTQQKNNSNRIIESAQNLANPYNLIKNQNIITNYQKKKTIVSAQKQLQSQKESHSDQKSKKYILKTQNQKDDNFSAVSQSVLSQNSGKSGRQLIKPIKPSDSISKSKLLLTKSQSKIKLSEREINTQGNEKDQKLQQSPNYYRPRISVNQLLKNNQNQSKVSQLNSNSHSKSSKFNKNSSRMIYSRQIEKDEMIQNKKIQDYKTDYYTPNPHSSKHFQSASRIKYHNDSQLGSDLQSNVSQFEKFDNESQESQLSDINDQQSLKIGKAKFLSSSSRLKREEILRKSNLRSSRNSQKSLKSNMSKKISLNPKKSSEYQMKIQHKNNQNKSGRFQKENEEEKISVQKIQQTQNDKENPREQQSQSFHSSSSSDSSSLSSLNQPSIVKFMKQQKLQSASKKETHVQKHPLLPTQYKTQLMVESVQSEIQSFQPSKIREITVENKILQNIAHANGFEPNNEYFNHQTIKNQQLSETKKIVCQPKDLTESNGSSKLISSMKRSGLRKSIKNSIHHLGVQSQNSMLVSKHPKSNLLSRSGKDLKPLTISNPKIEDFLAYIDEYEIIIGFLYLYVENTLAFYCKENQDERRTPQTERFLDKIKNQRLQKYDDKYERLSFLVLKKYFYEKNRLIKCLRGLQKNIFKLSGLEIPDEILKKFLNHEQTKEKLKQIELQTKQVFKELDEKFKDLRSKGNNKKDKLIKIEAPYDNFSRDIVSNLVEELNQLTAEIDELQIDTSSSNASIPLKRSKHFQSLTSVIAQQIFTSQQRGVEIMEIVFLISQLQSRKVKKVELINISEIDFEVYYQKYIDKLLEAYEFFESIKYPSDETEKKVQK